MRARVTSRWLSFLIAACALPVVPLAAQNNFNTTGPNSVFHGVPASVTSFGFGGHAGFHGVPASVTSPGFGTNGFRLHSGFGNGFGRTGFRHHRSGFFAPFFGGGYYSPYAYPVYVIEPGVDDSMEQDYVSGPTIFDRTGPAREPIARPAPAEEDYRSELHAKAEATPASTPPVQQPVAEQPRTVLVFKDGHQQEVVNYAIVGATLYDLSDGRTRRVALAELDLPATVKQNDERGVDFQVPALTKTN